MPVCQGKLPQPLPPHHSTANFNQFCFLPSSPFQAKTNTASTQVSFILTKSCWRNLALVTLSMQGLMSLGLLGTGLKGCPGPSPGAAASPSTGLKCSLFLTPQARQSRRLHFILLSDVNTSLSTHPAVSINRLCLPSSVRFGSPSPLPQDTRKPTIAAPLSSSPPPSHPRYSRLGVLEGASLSTPPW